MAAAAYARPIFVDMADSGAVEKTIENLLPSVTSTFKITFAYNLVMNKLELDSGANAMV